MTEPREILLQSRPILDPLLYEHGFSFEYGGGGVGGGAFARGSYVCKNRTLDFRYRYSLGLVTYRFSDSSIDHASYMNSVLGTAGGNKYPGFAGTAFSQFQDLACDLQHFATAFLNDDFEELSRCIDKADALKKPPGLARLP